MVKHIYIFTLISICMPIWVRFIVFEKEYFCSSGRRIRCKWDVGNMCFTIVKRIVGMLSKQKRYSKFLFSTGFFYTPPYHAGIVFLLTPFHLSKESFSSLNMYALNKLNMSIRHSQKGDEELCI